MATMTTTIEAHPSVADSTAVKPANGVPALNATDDKPTSQLSAHDLEELAIADKYAAPDRYVGASEHDFHPWAGPIELKPCRFDNRAGTFVTLLANRTDKPASLGKHRHRGPVTAVTLKGSWHYDEYEWRAGPGDYVVESPGTIHTLNVGPHTEVLFTVTGSLEFYNDDDTLRQTMDLFSFQKLYLDDCKNKNIKPDDTLWF